MILKCDQDCWNCALEGCPYTLEVQEELEEFAKKKMPIQIKRRMWLQSERGKECNRKGQQTYRKRHPDKYNKDHAKHEWIKDNTRRNGKRPTKEEIEEWSKRYDLKKARKRA